MFLEAGTSKIKMLGGGLLPRLLPFSLYPHTENAEHSGVSASTFQALIPSWGLLSMTSSRPKHLQKAPPPNAIAQTIRILTCKLGVRRWGRAHLLHN